MSYYTAVARRRPPLRRNPALGSTAAPITEIRESEAWCSVKHPMGTCKPQAGIAKPMTVAAYDAFKRMQGELNRMAAAKNLKDRIAIDGQIGPATVALYQKVTGVTADHDQLAFLCVVSNQAITKLASAATAAGVPIKIPPPPVASTNAPAPPPKVAPDGRTLIQDTVTGSIFDKAVAHITSPVGLAAAGALGVGLFLLTRKGGSRSTSVASSPAALTNALVPNPRRRRRMRRNGFYDRVDYWKDLERRRRLTPAEKKQRARELKEMRDLWHPPRRRRR